MPVDVGLSRLAYTARSKWCNGHADVRFPGLDRSIADIDETVTGEPLHPLTVVVVATDEALTRVIVPDRLIDGQRELLVCRSVNNWHMSCIGFRYLHEWRCRHADGTSES